MNPLDNATVIHLHQANQHVPTIIVFDRPVPDEDDDYTGLDATLLCAVLRDGVPGGTYDALLDLLIPDAEE